MSCEAVYNGCDYVGRQLSFEDIADTADVDADGSSSAGMTGLDRLPLLLPFQMHQ